MQAAVSYDEAAVLAQETGARMAQRLDLIRLTPHRIADIGCATGDGIRALQQRYKGAQPLAIDYALPMLQQVRKRCALTQRLLRRTPHLLNADVRALPLAARSLDLVWSNLMLHWLDDPLPALRELHRVLAVDGLLMFAMLGPDTLKPLRATSPSIRRFHDMHDIGDMLVTAGFADPVMDMEMISLTYASPRQFLADQRHLGVRNALLGQQAWQHWRQQFHAWEKDSAGRHHADFEIIFGHAWKAQPRQTADGRSVVQLHRR